MAKKNPSIFSTLQKTTANASAVNGEFTRQLPVDALEDNPMNRFSMAEDEQFTSTMASVEADGFLEDIVVTPSETEGRWRIISGHRRSICPETGQGHGSLQSTPLSGQAGRTAGPDGR